MIRSTPFFSIALVAFIAALGAWPRVVAAQPTCIADGGQCTDGTQCCLGVCSGGVCCGSSSSTPVGCTGPLGPGAGTVCCATDQPCCFNPANGSPLCCDSGTFCTCGGTCCPEAQRCGGQGNGCPLCCAPGDTCDSSTFPSRCVPACGASGAACSTTAPCCDGLTCGRAGTCVCATPLCNGTCCASDETCKKGVCTACGGDGEVCCSGSVCNGGFACKKGTCLACGGVGQPCCDGSTCNGALACKKGSCVGTSPFVGCLVTCANLASGMVPFSFNPPTGSCSVDCGEFACPGFCSGVGSTVLSCGCTPPG